MEQKFDEIINSWINGQRSQCAEQFDRLTENEKHNFKGWITDSYYDSPVADEYFKMVLFLLIR